MYRQDETPNNNNPSMPRYSRHEQQPSYNPQQEPGPEEGQTPSEASRETPYTQQEVWHAGQSAQHPDDGREQPYAAPATGPGGPSPYATPDRGPGTQAPYTAPGTGYGAPPPTSPYTYQPGGAQGGTRGTLSKGYLLGLGALLLGLLAMGLIGGWQLRDLSVAEQRGNPPTSTFPSLGGDNAESTREAVVAKVRPSVVQINVATARGNGLGSGVVIDKRGYIVTNNHVVEGAQRLQVMMANGTALPAQLVGTAPMDDLAVVKIDPRKTDLTVASPGDSSNLKVGQTVLAIGNPLGITQTVTSGIVSALDRNVTNPNGDILPGTIQTDAPINPGNSGGALVDLQGNLVGIPTLVPIDPQFKTPANGVGFAIPVNRVKFITPQLINSGHVTNTGRAALGIQAATIDPVLAAQNNLPVDHGVLVAGVTPGGAADRAGMRSGDIIVQIDNTSIDDASTLSDVLIQKKPDDVVKVQVYRGNQQMTVNVKLGVLSAP